MKPYLKSVKILEIKYGTFSYRTCTGITVLRCPRCKNISSLCFEMHRSSDDSKEYDEVHQQSYCAYCGKKLVKE